MNRYSFIARSIWKSISCSTCPYIRRNGIRCYRSRIRTLQFPCRSFLTELLNNNKTFIESKRHFHKLAYARELEENSKRPATRSQKPELFRLHEIWDQPQNLPFARLDDNTSVGKVDYPLYARPSSALNCEIFSSSAIARYLVPSACHFYTGNWDRQHTRQTPNYELFDHDDISVSDANPDIEQSQGTNVYKKVSESELTFSQLELHNARDSDAREQPLVDQDCEQDVCTPSTRAILTSARHSTASSSSDNSFADRVILQRRIPNASVHFLQPDHLSASTEIRIDSPPILVRPDAASRAFKPINKAVADTAHIDDTVQQIPNQDIQPEIEPHHGDCETEAHIPQLTVENTDWSVKDTGRSLVWDTVGINFSDNFGELEIGDRSLYRVVPNKFYRLTDKPRNSSDSSSEDCVPRNNSSTTSEEPSSPLPTFGRRADSESSIVQELGAATSGQGEDPQDFPENNERNNENIIELVNHQSLSESATHNLAFLKRPKLKSAISSYFTKTPGPIHVFETEILSSSWANKDCKLHLYHPRVTEAFKTLPFCDNYKSLRPPYREDVPVSPRPKIVIPHRKDDQAIREPLFRPWRQNLYEVPPVDHPDSLVRRQPPPEPAHYIPARFEPLRDFDQSSESLPIAGRPSTSSPINPDEKRRADCAPDESDIIDEDQPIQEF